jgi:hypothetical protein
MPSTIALAQQRALIHWYRDGLGLILAGLPAFFFGFYLSTDSTHRSTLSGVLSIMAMFAYAVLMLGTKPLLEWLKGRITYPRTGYVAPYFTECDPHSQGSDQSSLFQTDIRFKNEIDQIVRERVRRTLFYGALMLGYILAFWLSHNPWVCMSVGLIAGFAMRASSPKDERFSLWIPVGLGLLGLYLSRLTVHSLERIGHISMGFGILVSIEGLIRLIRFLLQNPLPKPAAPEQDSHGQS